MRLFVGFALTESITAALARLDPGPTRGMRWMRPDQMHVTLHFIGAANVDEVREALRSVEAGSFQLTVRGVGQFKSAGGRTILWAGVEATDALLAVHEAVGRALATTGFTIERRRYVPHVSLARIKPFADRTILDEFLEVAAERDFGECTADRFILYDSLTLEDGAQYTEIESYPLS